MVRCGGQRRHDADARLGRGVAAGADSARRVLAGGGASDGERHVGAAAPFDGKANARSHALAGHARDPAPIWLPMLLSAVAGCAFGAFFQFMPLLVERRGEVNAGLLYTSYGIAIITTRLLTGRFIDEAAPHLVLRVSFLASAIGLLLLAATSATPALIAAAILIAAGGGTQTPMLIRIHVERTPEDARGRAVAWYYLGFDLGIGSGAWLLAPALEWLGISTMFLVAAAVACVGIALVGLLARAAQYGVSSDNVTLAQ